MSAGWQVRQRRLSCRVSRNKGTSYRAVGEKGLRAEGTENRGETYEKVAVPRSCWRMEFVSQARSGW